VSPTFRQNISQIANAVSDYSYALIREGTILPQRSLKISSIYLTTISPTLETNSKIDLTWSGGRKPYFVEFDGGNGWETISGENGVDDKKFSWKIPYTKTNTGVPYCFRIGYVKQIKNGNSTYLGDATCIEPVENTIEGDIVSSDTRLVMKGVTLYELTEDNTNSYRAVTEWSGGKKPYALEIKPANGSWISLGSTNDKKYNVNIPSSITSNTSSVCFRARYQKTDRKLGLINYVGVPSCIELLSAIPDPNNPDIPLRSVTKLRASKITWYNLKLSWKKDNLATGGYAIYRDGELAGQTTKTTFTEEPILMPGTPYVFNVVVVPLNVIPPENLPPIVLASVNKATLGQTAVGDPATDEYEISSIESADTKGQNGMEAVEVEMKEMPLVPSTGTIKALVLPVGFADTTDSYYNQYQANLKRMIENDVHEVDDFYSISSFGKIKMTTEVSDVITLKQNRPIVQDLYYPRFLLKGMYSKINKAANTNGFDTSKYNLIVYVFPTSKFHWYSGIVDSIGVTTQGIVKGRIWINGTSSIISYVHEVGHKLGLAHANLYFCADDFDFYPDPRTIGHGECVKTEYGDEHNILGTGIIDNDEQDSFFDSFQKYELGWIKGGQVTQNGIYDILPTIDKKVRHVYLKDPSSDNKDFSGDLYFQYIRVPYFNDPYRLLVKEVGESSFFENLVSRGKVYSTYLHNTRQIRIGEPITLLDFNARLIPIRFQDDKAVISIRFLSDSVPVLTATPTDDYKKTSLSWTPVDLVAGYEVYRDSTDSDPIYIGKAPQTNDNAPGQHIYYVRAFDEFPELPGQRYYLGFSDPVTATYIPPPPPLPPDGTNSSIIYTDNACPNSYDQSANIIISNFSELARKASSVSGAGWVDVFVNGEPLGFYNLYGSSSYNAVYNRSNDTLALSLNEWVSSDTRRTYNGELDIRVMAQDSRVDYDYYLALLYTYNDYLYEHVGGSCKIGQMKYTKQTITTICPAPKDIIYNGKGSLGDLQAMNLTPNVNCVFDTLTITDKSLLYPNYVKVNPNGGAYTDNGTYTFSKSQGTTVLSPSSDSSSLNSFKASSTISLPLTPPKGWVSEEKKR